MANYLSHFSEFSGIETAGKKRVEEQSAHLNLMLSMRKTTADVHRVDARRGSMQQCVRRNDISAMLHSRKKWKVYYKAMTRAT